MDQFKCPACQSYFENSSNLALHVKFHVSYRHFKCLFCDNFHRRLSPYDRLKQNNRYVGCSHKNNVDFNFVTKRHSYQEVTQQTACKKVTNTSGPKEYAEEVDLDVWLNDLITEEMTLEEVRDINKMLRSMLEHAENFDIDNFVKNN